MASFHEEEVLGKAYDGRLMRRLLRYARPYAGLAVAAIVLLFLDGALQLVGPILTRRVIDVAIPNHDVHMVGVAAALLGASLVADFAAQYGETMLTALLGQRVMRDLRQEIFGHLQRLPISFYDRNPVGRLITRVTSDVEALNEMFTAGVVAGLGDLFTLLAISIMMLVTDWKLALATFAVIPFVWLTSHLFRVKVRTSYRDIRTRLARINAFLQERLTGIRIVQLFGREHSEAERFDELNAGHRDANLKSITYYALYFPAIELLTTVALAALLVTAANRVHLGLVTVGTVAAFLQLVRRFFQPLQDLSDKFNTLQQAMASSERIFGLLDTEVSGPAPELELGMRDAERGTRNSTNEAAVPASRVPRRLSSVTVSFNDVWFAYDRPHDSDRAERSQKTSTTSEHPTQPGDPEWVLKGVSFEARAGETLAIVGHTGAGKTTIVSLLLRFYEPQRGSITITGDDGRTRDVRDIPIDELRELIGYVQQDIFLFAGDITTNIRLAAPISEEDVALAAQRVGADRIIRRLPNGYSHVLGERGASVSVGERQLLSFARAIAANPALLVLDEATSAVDSEIEADIQRALAELMEGRTTIAIAHRLSTIVGADEILVLHHGEVRERGTHRELMALGGLYERLYRLQMGEAADRPRITATT